MKTKQFFLSHLNKNLASARTFIINGHYFYNNVDKFLKKPVMRRHACFFVKQSFFYFGVLKTAIIESFYSQ